MFIVLVLYYRLSWYTALVANWNKNSFLEIFSPVVSLYKTQTRSKMLKNIWRAHFNKISTSHCIYSPSGPSRLHQIFYYHKSFSGIRLLLFFDFYWFLCMELGTSTFFFLFLYTAGEIWFDLHRSHFRMSTIISFFFRPERGRLFLIFPSSLSLSSSNSLVANNSLRPFPCCSQLNFLFVAHFEQSSFILSFLIIP